MNHADISEFLPYLSQEELDKPIPEAVIKLYESERRAEIALSVRKYRNKDVFSLDADDGIENDAALVMESPQEILEREMEREQLYAALSNLPERQFKRIYAHFFLCMSKAEIARSEAVAENAVKDAIRRGLKNLERELKKYR